MYDLYIDMYNADRYYRGLAAPFKSYSFPKMSILRLVMVAVGKYKLYAQKYIFNLKDFFRKIIVSVEQFDVIVNIGNTIL